MKITLVLLMFLIGCSTSQSDSNEEQKNENTTDLDSDSDSDSDSDTDEKATKKYWAYIQCIYCDECQITCAPDAASKHCGESYPDDWYPIF